MEEIVLDSLSRVDETKKKSSLWVDMLAWNVFISCFKESDWQCKLCTSVGFVLFVASVYRGLL